MATVDFHFHATYSYVYYPAPPDPGPGSMTVEDNFPDDESEIGEDISDSASCGSRGILQRRPLRNLIARTVARRGNVSEETALLAVDEAFSRLAAAEDPDDESPWLALLAKIIELALKLLPLFL